MREHREHYRHKQPSVGETFFGLIVFLAMALAIWFFVGTPKNIGVNTPFERLQLDTMDEPTAAPEG